MLREEILALSRPRSEDLKRLAENASLFLLSHIPVPITDGPQRYGMKALDSSPDLKNVNEFRGHYLTLLGAEGFRKKAHTLTVDQLRSTDLRFWLQQNY